jgi:hypothetical protein
MRMARALDDDLNDVLRGVIDSGPRDRGARISGTAERTH